MTGKPDRSVGSPVGRRSVAIVHPWLPQYRIEFFERLRDSLDRAGVDLSLAHGANPPFARNRGDDRTVAWAERLVERELRLGPKTIVYRNTWEPAVDADLLILEDGLRNVDTYVYLARRTAARKPTAFWGHGRTMDKSVGKVEQGVKRVLLRRADWWFAYTRGVRDGMIDEGLPAERITAVQNTFDTTALAEGRSQVTDEMVADRRSDLDLTKGHTVLFIGGLGPSKNLDLLVEAGRILAAADPLFRVVIAGSGPERERLERIAVNEPFLRLVGSVFEPVDKAVLAAACDLLAVPGLVGLVAIDSFVLGIPIVTVSPWNHAPEFEYLRDGENCVIAAPEAASYAAAIRSTLADPALLASLSAECSQDSSGYTLEAMVDNFAAGVCSALGLSRSN